MLCYLLIGLLSLIFGLFLYFKYPEPKLQDFLNYDSFHPVYIRNKRCRYFGIILIIIGVVLILYSLYLYFYKPEINSANMCGEKHFSNMCGEKHSANMSGNCQVCNEYTKRREKLIPFKTEEQPILKAYADACNNCSKECTTDLLLAERNAKLGGFPIDQKAKKECIEITKEAIIAKQQLERLAEKGVKKLVKKV